MALVYKMLIIGSTVICIIWKVAAFATPGHTLHTQVHELFTQNRQAEAVRTAKQLNLNYLYFRMHTKPQFRRKKKSSNTISSSKLFFSTSTALFKWIHPRAGSDSNWMSHLNLRGLLCHVKILNFSRNQVVTSNFRWKLYRWLLTVAQIKQPMFVVAMAEIHAHVRLPQWPCAQHTDNISADHVLACFVCNFPVLVFVLYWIFRHFANKNRLCLFRNRWERASGMRKHCDKSFQWDAEMLWWHWIFNKTNATQANAITNSWIHFIFVWSSSILVFSIFIEMDFGCCFPNMSYIWCSRI